METDGLKSLRDACGIKYKNKRRALIGINKGRSSMEKKLSIEKNKNKEKKSSLIRHSENKKNDNKILSVPLKLGLLTLGRKVRMQRFNVEKQMMNLGEEEQAAVLLMALSRGSVYG